MGLDCDAPILHYFQSKRLELPRPGEATSAYYLNAEGFAHTYMITSFQIAKYHPNKFHPTVSSPIEIEIYRWGGNFDSLVLLEADSILVSDPLELPEPIVALDPLTDVEIRIRSISDRVYGLGHYTFVVDWDPISRIQKYAAFIEFTNSNGDPDVEYSLGGASSDFAGVGDGVTWTDQEGLTHTVNAGRHFVVFRISTGVIGRYTIRIRAENERYEVSPWFTYSGQTEGDLLAGATQDLAPVVQQDPDARNKQTVQQNEKVITEQGYGVSTLYGLHTIALKPLDPTDCGAIGNQAVCDMNVLEVADLSGHAQQGIEFCFPQLGQVLFLPSHDENGVPIDQKTAQPLTLPVRLVDGQTCVTVYQTGKLVLVESDSPLLAQTQEASPPVFAYSPTGSGDAPVTGCFLPLLLRPGDIAKASTTVNIRSTPAATGYDLGDLIPNELVSVIEGPVVADNYLWFKVRRVPTARPNEVWVAESGTRGDGCGYFFVKDQSAAFQSFDISDEGKEAIAETVPAFHSDAQLQAAEDAIVDTLIFTCDVLTSGGISLSIDGLKELLKAAIHESVRQAGLSFSDFSADELRQARDNGTLKQSLEQIPQLLDKLAVILDAIPSGVCSYDETVIALVTGELLLEWLEAGTPDPVLCEISSEEPVLAYNWPSGEGIAVAKLFAEDGLKPAGFVQLPGQPRFYMIRGAFGFEGPRFGAFFSRIGLFLNPEGSTYGAVFVHVSHAQTNEECGNLIDLSELMLHTDPTGDGRGVVDPRIILARNPESSACKMSIVPVQLLFGESNPVHFLYDSVGEAETPGSSRREYRGRGYEYSILKVVTFGGGTGSAYVQRVGKPDIRGWLRLEGAVFNLAAAKFAPNVSSCFPGPVSLYGLLE